MVENDFTGWGKFFFAKVTPKRATPFFLGPKTPKIFQIYFVPSTNSNILKVTKYQHHMTVFKKLTVEIVRAWRNPPPPPPA